MSEASDKVRGLHELPLFPLPVVLFPGVPLPLHIFEPRYRQMLLDIRLAKNLSVSLTSIRQLPRMKCRRQVTLVVSLK
jgi:Lon protease-like protein